MEKKKVLGLVSAVVVCASLVATAMGYGPLADEIKEAVCNSPPTAPEVVEVE